MNRTRLIAVATGAVVLAGAVALLRSGVEPPTAPVLAPNGQQIRAFHDASLVDPPARPDGPPSAPGELRADPRTRGALVTWPSAPYGFEVRWGREGGPLDQLRYVATTGTTLTGLDPGRYRVEARSVDDVGQRSEPSGADVEVTDGPQPWQRGLGFVQDFTQGAELTADDWILDSEARRCLSREPDGPVLLNGQCFAQLRPASKLVLSEPDQDGVRGRVLVIADTPPPAPPRDLPGDPGQPDNELMMGVGPDSYFGLDTVMLRVGSRQSYLMIGQEPDGDAFTVELDQDGAGGPGVQHRWELAFTGTEVHALRDGVRVGTAPYRPTWQESDVFVSAFVMADRGPSVRAGVSVVGLTGAPSDGQPTEVFRSTTMANEPTSENRIRVEATPTAARVTITGFISAYADQDTNGLPPPAPEVVGEFAGQQVTLRRRGPNTIDNSGYAYQLELPVDGVRAGGDLILRSVDGSPFASSDASMEVRHEKGTVLRTRRVPTEKPTDLTLARPELVLRRGENTLISGQRLRGGEVQVEVDVSTMQTQHASLGLVGWVALRVELDGERILDHPTAVSGPALIGRYRFTLKLDKLRGTSKTLLVKLVPDRNGVQESTASFTLRMQD